MVLGKLLMRLLFGVFNDLADNINTLLDTQNTGVKRDVIVLGLSPGPTGVVLIVYTTALVLFVQTLLGALIGLAVAAHNAFSTVCYICKYKSMQCIGTVLQDVVSITANNDAGTLLGQLQYDAALDIPQEVGSGQTIHHTGDTLRGKGVGKQAAAGGVLAVLFHELGSKAGFQCDLIDQFLIVERNAQTFCNHTANTAAAGAKFTADGDDFLFHISASFETKFLFYVYYSQYDRLCQ